MDKISIRAPAKINLYLLVLTKRSDGFHEIESLMQAVDLYDDITLEKANSIELRCDDPSLPADESNLAFRAAMALRDLHPFPGVKISLVKNIPVGAGLGGGSSDAAFVLRGLCLLYDLHLTAAQLHKIAASLGSDVPFFLTAGQALAKGRGEILEPLRLPLDYEIAVVSPRISIPTGEIYRQAKFDLTYGEIRPLIKSGIDFSGFKRLTANFRNDLEEVVLAKYPVLSDLKRSLLGSGAFYSSMTGSGSSFFALYNPGAEKSKELENLSERGIRVTWCRPIALTLFAGHC